MSDLSLFQALTLIGLFINSIIAIGAFVRVGKWRDSDDARKISDTLTQLVSDVTSDDGRKIKSDIHDIKNHITRIDVRLTGAERANEKVSEVEGRIAGMENQLSHMATRADISELRGELAGAKGAIKAACDGVERIEAFMMAVQR